MKQNTPSLLENIVTTAFTTGAGFVTGTIIQQQGELLQEYYGEGRAVLAATVLNVRVGDVYSKLRGRNSNYIISNDLSNSALFVSAVSAGYGLGCVLDFLRSF